MVQTQIQLTEEQLAALEELAKQRNVSLPALIREGIDHLLRSVGSPWNGRAEQKRRALAIARRF